MFYQRPMIEEESVKDLQKSSFLLFFVFVLGLGSAVADENPIDFKQSRNAWVVWTELSNGESQILASKWDSNKWSEPSLVSQTQQDNIAPSITIDPAGNPWVVWARNQGVESSIYLSRFNGKKWLDEQVLSSSNGRENVTPSIAFGPQGNAIVAWGSVLSRSSDIQVREWNGTKWGKVATLTQEDLKPDMMPAVSFDAKGNALVAWVSLDQTFKAKLASSWKQEDGSWSSENELVLGDTEFGFDLPTFKVNGETLTLYFEESNQFFASQWNGQDWTEKKSVDTSNAFYEVLTGLEGNAQGRAWFAWTNNKGKGNSFRYNVVAHDAMIAGDKPTSFQYLSNYLDIAVEKTVSLFAWIMGEEDVFAGGGGGGGGDKGPFTGSKAATGDSITSGSPGTSWVPFWAEGVQNTARAGARATASASSVIRRITRETQVVVLWMGTNDVGDGRATGDIVAALVAAANVGRVERGYNTVFLTTISKRNDGNNNAAIRLADGIRANGAHPVIDTFNALNNDSSNIGDSAGHLSESGASAAGSVVRRAAFPRN